MTLEKAFNVPLERPNQLPVKEKNSWGFFPLIMFRLAILWGKDCPVRSCNYDKTSPEVCFRGGSSGQKTEAMMSPLKHIAEVSWSSTAHGRSKRDS